MSAPTSERAAADGPALVCDPDRRAADDLGVRLGGAPVFDDLTRLREYLLRDPQQDTVVLGANVPDQEAFAVADYLRVNRPGLGVVLVRHRLSTELLQQALRAGAREVVADQDLPALQAAVQRSTQLSAALRRHSPPAAQPPPPAAAASDTTLAQVSTVFGVKGGCGKTMLATNLAATLAEHGRRRVCLIDLDLAFGDVAVALQLFPAHTIADTVPMGAELDSDAVTALLTTHSPGLSVLPAPVDPSIAELVPLPTVARLLEVLRTQFDHVVIDTAASFDDRVMAALEVSDVVAMLVTPDVPALKNLRVALATLKELRYPKDRLRLVLNRSDAKVGISHSEVEAAAGLTLAGQIPSSRDVPYAINRGVPIVLEDPHHPVSQAVREFAHTQLTDEASPPARARSGRGLLMRARKGKP